MTTWKEDRPKALGLLQVPAHQILKDADAPQDLVSILEQQGIDQLLLRDADPALAMNLLQVLCDSYVFLLYFLKTNLLDYVESLHGNSFQTTCNFDPILVIFFSPFGRQIALKLADSTAELLSDRQRPYHVQLAASCLVTLLQGPLASPDPQGNGAYKWKRFHWFPSCTTCQSYLMKRKTNVN